MSEDRPLNPEAERAIAKVRRLMMIASVTTFLAVAAVLVVIGYRVFRMGESAAPPATDAVAVPAGAKILSSAVGDGHIVLTVETGAGIELFSFDLTTLRPLGHARVSKP
jgi:hypothetical protein